MASACGDSALTDYKVTNTPYGRDPLAISWRKPATDAASRSASTTPSWTITTPVYPNQGRAHELAGPQPGDEPDVGRYLDYVRGQIRELCTHYGTIGGIWWDAQRLGVEDAGLNAMVRELQPAAVINDRGLSPGDVTIYERDYSKEVYDIPAFARATEACQAIGMQSWGFRRDEDYYTVPYLIQSIDRMMAKGANYLLNVGPDALGRIAPNEEAILRRIGDWYLRVREAFAAEPAPGLTDKPPGAGDAARQHRVRASARGAGRRAGTASAPPASRAGRPAERRARAASLPDPSPRLPPRGRGPACASPACRWRSLQGETMVVRLDFAAPFGSGEPKTGAVPTAPGGEPA